MNKEKQLEYNINLIVQEYVNGTYDDPDNYPSMSFDKWISYFIPYIYNIKSDGQGGCWNKKDICGNLRFLGKTYIRRKIYEALLEENLVIQTAQDVQLLY